MMDEQSSAAEDYGANSHSYAASGASETQDTEIDQLRKALANRERIQGKVVGQVKDNVDLLRSLGLKDRDIVEQLGLAQKRKPHTPKVAVSSTSVDPKPQSAKRAAK